MVNGTGVTSSEEYKPAGMCPLCRKMIRAKVIESNKLLRDVCECPNCGGRILVCRAPGCHNYVIGGKYWDDELCPECTKGSYKAVSVAAGLVISLVTAGQISKN